MKTVQRTIYICSFCKKEFNSKDECLKHEKKYHMCPNCKHFWMLYGSEMNCDLLNKCIYEPKSK